MHNSAPARVLFYGVTGSGKSAAAHAYARASGLPEYSADDDIGWLPQWRQRSLEDQRRLAADIASREEWKASKGMPPMVAFQRPRDLDIWLSKVPKFEHD